jgi:hypothetical protein
VLNSTTTKTSSVCEGNMNDDFVEYMRGVLTRCLNRAFESDAILEYRYQLVMIDLLEMKTDEDVSVCIDEMKFGLFEKKRSELLERLNLCAEMIGSEADQEWKSELLRHYDELTKKIERVEDSCMIQTKY